MAIGIMNFPELNDTANIRSPLSTALESGLNTYGNLTKLQQGNADVEGKQFANQMAGAKAKYAPEFATAELQKAQAEPGLIQAQTTYQNALAKGVPSEIALRYAQAAYQSAQTQAMPSEVNLRNAQAAYQGAETQKQNILNKFLPQREPAEIGELTARSNYYNTGGAGGSTGSKEQALFQNMVARDNPQLSPDQSREAANVLASGGTRLSDGTVLNPMSPLTKMTYDRVIKSGSTSKLIASGVQANQAEAELKSMTDKVAPVFKEIGTTYLNKSPEQIIASFSNKPEEQEKLGRIIGARSLQYAIAQLRNRIDMGEPGINATRELMENSGQLVDTVAPRLTPAARIAAMNFVNEAAIGALKARNEYGVGASSATGKAGNVGKNENITRYVRVNGKLVRE